jgi:hypothetical protein
MRRLRRFVKTFDHQLGLNNLGTTIRTNNSILKIQIKTNPGDKIPATTPTGTDAPAFFARCRATVRKSVARG